MNILRWCSFDAVVNGQDDNDTAFARYYSLRNKKVVSVTTLGGVQHTLNILGKS